MAMVCLLSGPAKNLCSLAVHVTVLALVTRAIDGAPRMRFVYRAREALLQLTKTA